MIYEIKILNEGINDKNIFKAIFLAGGGGSGKSFIAKQAFGLGVGNVSALGARVVNSDYFFEKGLDKLGLSKTIDVANIELYKTQMEVRDWAKKLTKSQMAMYINGMLPLILDGTGRDYDKIISQAEVLQSIGYDTSMIFVNTSLNVALERNAKRERKVDPKIVETAWYDVQANIGKFQKYFGNRDFDVVDNSTYFEPGSKEAKDFSLYLYKIGKKHLESPLDNYKGISIIKKLKATGGKYLSDLIEE